MRKHAGFVAVGICLFLSAMSQSKLPGNFFTKKLPNGLELLVIEDHTVPLVTIEIATKNGAYTEDTAFNGLSHLYEHMFFKANKDYPSQEAFMAKVKELGIDFNGTTSNELVNYYFTLPSYNLALGLNFMNSAIQYPKFDSTEMKKENVVVDGEFQRQESNPFFAIRDAVNHHMWGDLYSRKNGIGNHDIIRSATPAKMQAIKNKYYWPNNSMLTIAGDVSHEDVFAKAATVFSGWKPAGFDPFAKWPIPEFKPLEKTDYFIIPSPLAQVPMMVVQWQGPDTRKDVEGTYAADLYSTILAQNSSKLHKVLVDSGLALFANISYLTAKHTGVISLTVVPNPMKIKECVKAVQDQIAMFDKDDYFTDEQIEVARRQREIATARESEVTSSYVHTVSFWWASASLEYYSVYLDKMKKLTRADMQQYVRKYITGKPYVAGLLVNEKMYDKVKSADFFKAN